MDEEFDNFLVKVNEVERLVKDMNCTDPRVAERARMRADLVLRTRGGEDANVDGRGMYCGKDRTVINQRAFDKSDDPAEMSKEAFMAEVERDAAKRTKDRKERKQRSDEWKRKANEAFRKQDFEKALDMYNKAIDETKDSCVLYENRALTCLHLKLYRRVLDDCEWALRLNETSLKALLYKARALHWLSQRDDSEKCLDEAKQKHPQHKEYIEEYVEMWKNENDD